MITPIYDIFIYDSTYYKIIQFVFYTISYSFFCQNYTKIYNLRKFVRLPVDILEQLFYNIDIKQMFVTLFDT